MQQTVQTKYSKGKNSKNTANNAILQEKSNTNTVYGYGCAELQYSYPLKQSDEQCMLQRNKEKMEN